MKQDIICPGPLTEEALTQAVETFLMEVRPGRERLYDYYRSQQPVPKGEAVRGRPNNLLRIPFPRYITEVHTGYFLGLPERPIQSILLENCVFTYAPDAKPFVPAMADGVAECLHQGLIIRYAGQVTLRNVCLTGQQGERLNAEQVESITWEDEA